MLKDLRSKSFLHLILDNLFDFVTISVAVYFVVKNEIKPIPNEEISQLVSWVLAVLGLIAVSGIWDRNRRMSRIERLVKETDNRSLQSYQLLHQYISGLVTVGDLLKTDTAVEEDFFHSATKIVLTGITLQQRTRQFTNILEERLLSGASIRLVLLEPSDSNLKQMQDKGWAIVSLDQYKNIIESTVIRLKAIAQNPRNKGKMEIGYSPFFPSVAFEMVAKPSGEESCWITIFAHNTSRPNPAFRLNKSEDVDWYNFFRNQFELLWSNCHVERHCNKRGGFLLWW